MDTIYSLVTKPINQTIAIIRISGPDTFEIIKKIYPLFNINQSSIKLMKLFDENGLFIDETLLLKFIKPNSFTGEDLIEINPHGNLYIVNKILSMLEKFGARQSQPGEFLKQSYMNGKIDFSQAEAINTMIVSNNKELVKIASQNLNGKESDFVKKLLKKLGEIVSNIQVSIDYPENQDLPKFNLKNIKNEIIKFRDELNKIIYDSKKLIKYSKGILISLIGIPNSGKSTLLNSLLKENKAIVSNIEGTTRDIVEGILYMNDVQITLRDTAGIRKKTNDKIEKEGIKRSFESINVSDIVVVILDGTKNLNNQREDFKLIYKNYQNKIIEIISKSDIIKHNGINISAFNNEIDKLIEAIDKFIKEHIFDNDKNNNALLITQNQIDKFSFINECLNNSIMLIENNLTADIVALELETAMKKLGTIIGIKINQEYMENLFANFCIGK